VKYLCKIQRQASQRRINLPKAFIEQNKWEDAEYLIINDGDGKNIEIRRFTYGKTEDSES